MPAFWIAIASLHQFATKAWNPVDSGMSGVFRAGFALASNLPFPKTRRIVFLNNKPATLPGWVELSIEG